VSGVLIGMKATVARYWGKNGQVFEHQPFDFGSFFVTVLLLRPRRFEDSRGWFAESWNQTRFTGWGVDVAFCQDNHSLSRAAGVLRGLHFQKEPMAQAKLVRCLRGRIFDVAVDLRRQSPTYLQWVAAELSAENGDQLFIPAGYAHGFLTLEPDCEVAYKVDAPYAPEVDGGVIWNDPDIGIVWPEIDGAPLLSDKDTVLPRIAELDIDFGYDGNPLKPLERIAQ
jgi:dTDP-4-dehydrorhamnose 3,5-epimerase